MSKRDIILDAALELFIQQGFEKTPTSAISKKAEVATGTLFHHFKTKEELINALYLDIKLKVKQALANQQEDVSDPNQLNGQSFKPFFERTWYNMMQWVLEHPQQFWFLAQFGESAHISSNTRERVDEAFSDWHALFEIGQQLNIFRPMPVELLLALSAKHMFTSAAYLIENPNDAQNETLKEVLFKSAWGQIALLSTEENTQWKANS